MASWCLLGGGRINRTHLKRIRALRPATKVAVATRDAESAERYAAEVGVPQWHGSYDEAIDAGYDGYVVATVPRLHAELVERIVGRGHHCLVEKPVFNSMAELQRLWPLLTNSRGVVMVAENVHFAPFLRKLLRLAREPTLGGPVMLDVVRLGRSQPSGWRADPAEMPLGALHEGGVHWIRRLLALAAVFEPDHRAGVVDVMAYRPRQALTTTPGEDTMMITARHRSGLISRLVHSWGMPWRFPAFDTSKLVTEQGAVYFDARGIFGRSYRPRGRGWILPSIRDAGGFTAMWRELFAAIDEDRQPTLDLRTIFDDFAYMDAAYRSVASGRPEAPALPPAALDASAPPG